MRALVTGASGFAGRFLVNALAAEGVEVHAVVHSGGAARGAASEYELDVRDCSAMSRVVSKVQPDEIYHLAGVTRPADDDVEEFYGVNLDGARNLFAAAAKTAPAARILLVGSAYAYAPCDKPIDESVPLAPVNHYGASKAAAEMLALAYVAEGLQVVRARPFNHSGPGQSPDFVLPSLVQQVVAQRHLGDVTLQVGNLDSVRDISDVRDVVAGYQVALRRGMPGRAYNVGSGRGWSIRELVQLVADTAGVRVRLQQTDDRVRRRDISALVANVAALKELGWYPSRDLPETIHDMVVAADSPVATSKSD